VKYGMCGRYAQTKKARDYAHLLQIRAEFDAALESWNLAPSMKSLVVRQLPEGLVASDFTWGLNDGTSSTIRPINARIESAASKPIFRKAWKERRCIVPVDGWYEWRTERDGKQPYYFFRQNGDPLFFAGLWSGDTFTLITTAAEGGLTQIHHRRPLALDFGDSRAWLETAPQSEGSIVAKILPASEIQFHPVTGRMNSPRNDGPQMIERIEILPSDQASIQMALFRESE
jgi:putative SOS response-associated peptidase YedK